MKNKWVSFGIIVAVVLVVTGVTVVLGRSSKNNLTKNTDNSPTTDQGSVKGTTSDDGVSENYKVALAKYLTEKGAVFYGAYWCPHCKDQKSEFGDALKYVDYVECDPGGENANPDECKAKGIESYPTWIYEGKQYTGAKSLSDLAQMVGFTDDSSSSTDQSGTDSGPTGGQPTP